MSLRVVRSAASLGGQRGLGCWQLSPEGTLGGRVGCSGTTVTLLVGVGAGLC